MRSIFTCVTVFGTNTSERMCISSVLTSVIFITTFWFLGEVKAPKVMLLVVFETNSYWHRSLLKCFLTWESRVWFKSNHNTYFPPATDSVEEGSVVVIPQNINGSMIRTEGPWSNFNLTWDTDTRVNHGTIFYKLFLQIGREQIHKVTFFCSSLLLFLVSGAV